MFEMGSISKGPKKTEKDEPILISDETLSNFEFCWEIAFSLCDPIHREVLIKIVWVFCRGQSI